MLNQAQVSRSHAHPGHAVGWTIAGVTLAILLAVGCTRFHDGSMAGAPVVSEPPATEPAGATVDAPDAPRFNDPVQFHDVAVRGARFADARGGRAMGLGVFGDVERGASSGSSGASNDGPENLRRITYTSEGNDFDPAIDPTGDTLVFASTRHRQNEAIYRKRIDGSTVTQLTDSRGRDVMPAFSPDGERIAFASDRTGTWDIYVMDASGGQAIQVTSDRRHNIHPSFSPDGRKLVYSSFGGPASQWEMVVVDLERPGTRQYLGPGLFPQWSPVDDRILFQRARERGTRWFSVWTVTLDERGEAGAPTEIAASTNAAVITPAWGPDGEHIVFCTVVDPSADEQQGDRPTRADVWVVRADGSGRARLTGGGFANLQPTWAGDGTIYFVSDRGGEGTESIWAIRPDQAVRLANPETRERPEPSARVE